MLYVVPLRTRAARATLWAQPATSCYICVVQRRVVHSLKLAALLSATSARLAYADVTHDRATDPRADVESTGERLAKDPFAEARPLMTRVAAVERKAAAEEDAIVLLLAEKCARGDLDSCFTAMSLKPVNLFVQLSSTKSPDLRQLAQRAKDLLDLCVRQHRPACNELGQLIYSFDESDHAEIGLLQRSGTLERTLTTALAADPRYQQNAPAIAHALATDPSVEFTADEMKGLASDCRKGSPGACLIGGVVLWSYKGGLESRTAGYLSSQPLAQELAQFCPRYSTVCASAAWHAYVASGDDAQYERAITNLCDKGDPTACHFVARRVDNAGRRTDAIRAYTRACDLGAAQSCEDLVQPLLDLGDTPAALTRSLASCQPSTSWACGDLLTKFQVAELGGITRRELAEYACLQGSKGGCYRLGIADYKAGNLDDARRRFGAMCVNEEDLRACRYAAQIDWRRGSRDRAQYLLHRGCQWRDDINSCIDLASLHQSEGRTASAAELIKKWCTKSQPGWGVPGGPHACRLERRFLTGWRPAGLNEIFSDPVDGSEYIGAPVSATAPPGAAH
jgi:uncharacterized protein